MTTPGPIESAVVHDLAALPDEIARSPLAASAIHLASVQDATTSAREAAAVASEFRRTWVELMGPAAASTGGEVDELDDFRKRREGGSGSASSVGT